MAAVAAMAIQNSYVAPVPVTNFGSIRLTIRELMWFEIGYRNGTNLAILNLFVAVVPFSLEGDAV